MFDDDEANFGTRGGGRGGGVPLQALEIQPRLVYSLPVASQVVTDIARIRSASGC
jgi:hypothetical protein